MNIANVAKVNLVIVAGGNGSRFKDLSAFPKILLPTSDTGSLLLKNMYYAENAASLTILLNDRFANLFECYTRVNNINDKIRVLYVHDTRNSAETVLSKIKDISSKNVLLVWSDLEIDGLDRIIDKCMTLDYDTVFTNDSGQYRYEISDRGIQKRYDYCGNVPGIYFIKDMSAFYSIADYSKYSDFADCLADILPNIKKIDIFGLGAAIREYRDLEEYVSIMHMHTDILDGQTRFFNKISEEHGGWLVKRVVDFKYKKLIDREKIWYRTLNTLGGKNIAPEIAEVYDDGFKMRNLIGYVTLRSALDRLESAQDILGVRRLYKNLFAKVEQCSALSSIKVSCSVFERDLRKELVTKVLDRCECISDILLNYDRKQLEMLLERVYKYIFELAGIDFSNDMTYSFCHGDLNGSNIMVDLVSGDIKFIDPRGYFGNTELYGWKSYEYAKILYCLSGYDNFNILPQVYTVDWPKDRLSLEWSGFKEFAGANYQRYKAMVGVIYVALAGYISQDVMKANIAYDYGINVIRENLP